MTSHKKRGRKTQTIDQPTHHQEDDIHKSAELRMIIEKHAEMQGYEVRREGGTISLKAVSIIEAAETADEFIIDLFDHRERMERELTQQYSLDADCIRFDARIPEALRRHLALVDHLVDAHAFRNAPVHDIYVEGSRN